MDRNVLEEVAQGAVAMPTTQDTPTSPEPADPPAESNLDDVSYLQN